jgi:hypothetical protein
VLDAAAPLAPAHHVSATTVEVALDGEVFSHLQLTGPPSGSEIPAEKVSGTLRDQWTLVTMSGGIAISGGVFTAENAIVARLEPPAFDAVRPIVYGPTASGVKVGVAQLAFGANVAVLVPGPATSHRYVRPAEPVSASVLAFVSCTGMCHGTGDVDVVRPGTATGGVSIGQNPAVQAPTQHGTPETHAVGAAPPMQAIPEVQCPPMQRRGAWQSPWVRHTPPSIGFGMQVPRTQPKEQQSASAAQYDA